MTCLLKLATSTDQTKQTGGTHSSLIESGVLPEFDDYELVEEIGRGGMGIVYRARQKNLNREVAVKTIIGGQLATPESVQRFRAEAEAAARLDHDGIIPIYEVGEHQTQHFFSMKLIEGGSLSQNMPSFVLPAELSTGESERRQRELAEMGIRIADAAEHAHQHGILHRDLKPGNVLVDVDGRPYLTDFGLAKLMTQETGGLTLTSAVLGSPSYMAPEQAAERDESVTTATDVYGIGATLYELLTGCPPFSRATAMATVRSVLDDPPEPLRRINRQIHQDLETIVLKCLEKSPADRYRSAAELTDELRRFCRGEPILARPVSSLEHLWRWCRRKPLIAALLTLLSLAIFSGLLGVFWQWRRAEKNNDQLQLMIDRREWDDIVAMTDRNENSEALAHLASRLRSDPHDWRSAMLATSILDHCRFAEPLCRMTHGDGNEVTSAVFSEDGALIATSAIDGTARLWNVKTGEELQRLEHGDIVNQVLLSTDGQSIISASDDHTAVIWNIADGRRRVTMNHAAGVKVVRQLNANRIALACDDGSVTIRQWESMAIADESSEIECVTLHLADAVTALSCAGDGLLAAADASGNAVIWDVGGEEPIVRREFRLDNPCRGIELSSDGCYVVTTSNQVTCRHVESGEVVFAGRAQEHFVPQWSHQQPLLHVLRTARDSVVIDPESRRQISNAISTKYQLFASAFSQDDEWLATGGWDYTASIWHVRNGTAAVSPIKVEGVVRQLQFSPDRQCLLIVEGSPQFVTDQPPENAAVSVWRLREPLSQSTYQSDSGRVGWVATTAGGDRTVVEDTRPKQLLLLNESLRCIGRFDCETGNFFHGIAISPDAARLYTGDKAGSVWCFELDSQQKLWGPVEVGSSCYTYRLSHDGRVLACADHAGFLTLIDTDRGTIRYTVEHGGDLNDVNFSPNDELIATAADDHTAKIWTAENGELRHTLKHDFRIQACKFSPDGTRIVTGSNDFSAQVWNVATGEKIGAAMQHQGEVGNASFSSDGRRILTSSRDATARIWDAETGQPLVPQMIHTSALREANFSPDGRLSLTVDHDALRIWDTESGQPVGVRIRRRSSSGVGHDSAGGRVPFLADGSAALWGHTTDRLQRIDTTIPPTPVPVWFPDFLEHVALQQLDEFGVPRILRDPQLKKRDVPTPQLPGPEFYSQRRKEWFQAANEAKALAGK